MRARLFSSDRGFRTLSCFKGFVVPHKFPQHRLHQSAGEPCGAPATGSGCAAAWTRATSASELFENSGSSETKLQQDVESRISPEGSFYIEQYRKSSITPRLRTRNFRIRTRSLTEAPTVPPPPPPPHKSQKTSMLLKILMTDVFVFNIICRFPAGTHNAHDQTQWRTQHIGQSKVMKNMHRMIMCLDCTQSLSFLVHSNWGTGASERHSRAENGEEGVSRAVAHLAGLRCRRSRSFQARFVWE